MRHALIIIGTTLGLAACGSSGGAGSGDDAVVSGTATVYACKAASKSATFQSFEVTVNKDKTKGVLFKETDGMGLVNEADGKTSFDPTYKPRAKKYLNYLRYTGLKANFAGSKDLLISPDLQALKDKGGMFIRFQGSDGGNTEAYDCATKAAAPAPEPGGTCTSTKLSSSVSSPVVTAARKLFDLFPDGMHGEFQMTCSAGATGLDRLKNVISQLEDSPEEIAIKSTPQDAIAIDTPEAGLLADGVKAALSSLSPSDVTEADKKKIQAQLEAAQTGKAIFGYYGFQQNGCAAPSPGLLIMDPATGYVLQLDMSPCRE